MQSSSILTVNLSSIQKNLSALSTQADHLMVMVKGNGYGTDAIFLSKYISTLNCKQIPFLGVAHVEEGILLREAGITYPIFVIFIPPHQAEYAIQYRLTTAINSFEEAEALDLLSRKHNIKSAIHLNIDTGLNRSGIRPYEALTLYPSLLEMKNLYLEGIFTHFVGAESEAFDQDTEEQIALFKSVIDLLPSKPKWIHAANSAGAVRFKLPFCNLARIGLGYLGQGPLLKEMENALTLKTHISAIKDATKGETVGYHRKHLIVQEQARIGVIPFGYFDGFPRLISGKGSVLVRGKKVPMIGNFCMDFIMVDLTTIPEAAVGDEVILFDHMLPLEMVADWAQTDMREILVKLSSRVKREWLFPSIITSTRSTVQYDKTTSSERFSSPICSF